MFNVSLSLQAYDIQITIGRSATKINDPLANAGAVAGVATNTINLVNQTPSTMILPQPTSSGTGVNYIAGLQGKNKQLEAVYCNLTGHAIDKPPSATGLVGGGTANYYYQIWMSSAMPSQNISSPPTAASLSPSSIKYQLSASLIALKVSAASA